jgi:thymidylate synthase ThyX
MLADKLNGSVYNNDGQLARRVYAVWGVPPETQAYALAKYSRSAQSMLESIAELSEQRAAEFLETFYFQYGHRSIADLAHLAIALENISILAAIRVVDEPLWDGQERSTRYQPFTRTKYHIPDGIVDDGLRERFVGACDDLFAAYAELSKGLTELLKRVVPRPEEMDDGAYTRTLRARAFDVARYLLPLATRTSVGQVVSARVLERQISRLLADPLPECQRIGQELRLACERPAEAPVLRKVLSDGGWAIDGDAAQRLLETRAAPTLVKYTAPDGYPPATYTALGELAGRLLSGLPGACPTGTWPSVELAGPTTLEEELVATLLFRADRRRRSYRQILERVRELPDERCRELLDAALAGRGRHDELLREHRAGYGLVFDVLMDVGGFRDMHRHRRCVQIVREPDPADGFDDPDELFRAGLGDDGAELARQTGHVARYRAAVERAFAAAAELAPRLGSEAGYLLPMAARVRALFKMDYAEAVYIAELRTGTGGHFSYRRVAWAMRQELARRHPELAREVRATDPYEVVDLLRR